MGAGLGSTAKHGDHHVMSTMASLRRRVSAQRMHIETLQAVITERNNTVQALRDELRATAAQLDRAVQTVMAVRCELEKIEQEGSIRWQIGRRWASCLALMRRFCA